MFDYDALHRPLRITVKDGDGASPLDNMVELFVYGEGQTNDKILNLRGRLYQHYDTGGLEETPEYNFKGQALSTVRTLASDYKTVVDWNVTSGKLEAASYTISTDYDALGRIRLQTAPDGSSITPSYNARGLLVSETVEQSAVVKTHLQSIAYDAKGQRLSVQYGNGMKTSYVYDRETFRLNRLTTTILSGRTPMTYQDLRFTYDAVGNTVLKQDDNIPTVFYNSSVVQGTNEYTYDARYQLLEATGREMLSSASFGASDNYDDAPFKAIQYPGDSMAMQNYTQYYAYDEVGNILQLQHAASTTGSYTRDYTYANNSNRLLRTEVGSDTYYYGYHAAHGFINSMPHLTVLDWNFKEEIAATSTQYVTSGTPETTYYQYDSQGTRLRKITENYASVGNTPTKKQERIYIAGWELYKEHSGPSAGLTCETLSLIDEGRRFVMIETTDDPSAGISKVTRYQHPNHQGSTTLETNEMGQVITYEEYHPFGTTAYQATNGAVTAAAKRYRYTGMERDDETGLEYHNARYYISWLGRWMNCDPIGIGDGVNVYAYCKNNPVGNVDTEGTQTAVWGAKYDSALFTPNYTIEKVIAPSSDKTAFSLQTKPINILTREQKLKVEAGKQFQAMLRTLENQRPDMLYDAADPSSPGGDRYSDGYIAAYQTRKIMENDNLKWYYKASFLFYMYGPTMLTTAGSGIAAKQGIQNMRTPYRDSRSMNFNSPTEVFTVNKNTSSFSVKPLDGKTANLSLSNPNSRLKNNIPSGFNVNIYGEKETPGFKDFAVSPKYMRGTDNIRRPLTYYNLSDNSVDNFVMNNTKMTPETANEIIRIAKPGANFSFTTNLGSSQINVVKTLFGNNAVNFSQTINYFPNPIQEGDFMITETLNFNIKK